MEANTDLDVILERAMSGDGSLAAHTREARDEAGLKLRNNRARVLRDMCNPTKRTIDGTGPVSQPDLVRLAPDQEELADDALREIERRLLGEGFASPATDEAGVVWAAVGTYLNGRLQASAEEKKGRKPDMSTPAAAAFRAVLQQLEWVVEKDLYANNREEMIEHLSTKVLNRANGTLANGLPVLDASEGSWKVDPSISKMAKKMGVPAPSAGPWLQMLCEVMENLPLAMLVVDMCVPGLPISYCNPAMADLTGYERGEIRGRNCRFLQGPMTEASSVRQIIVGIRTAAPTTVRLTNYHRDGSTFRNMVTINPVFDTEGLYRYSVAVLSDVERAVSDGNALNALRSVLPEELSADAQPPTFDVKSMRHASPEAQKKQYNDMLAVFMSLEWSVEWESSLAKLVSQYVRESRSLGHHCLLPSCHTFC